MAGTGARRAWAVSTLRRSCALPPVASGIVALAASAAVYAVSTAQEELAEVKRSVPNLDHGGELFETCSACHGADGGGTRDGQVPRIGGQHTSVLWKQLIDYRHDRRWDLRSYVSIHLSLILASGTLITGTGYRAAEP